MFFGRDYELKKLREEKESQYASLIVIQGRRRVGKTRLIKEAFAGKEDLWIFEGIEDEAEELQLRKFMKDLSLNTGDPTYEFMMLKDWMDAFHVLYLAWAKCNKPVIFFDEVQWIASFDKSFVSIFKAAWERHWSLDKQAVVVLCGSVAPFINNIIIKSKALYQRITTVINLEPLPLQEIKHFCKGKRHPLEILELFMSLGGIPKYFEYCDFNKSVELNLNELFFTKDGKLVNEYKSLFHSHFQDHAAYEAIVQAIYNKPGLTNKEIAGLKSLEFSSGGTLSNLLDSLCLSGFVEKYSSLEAKPSTNIFKYRVVDEYLIFYFKFVKANLSRINKNTKGKNLLEELNLGQSYEKWKGLAFERLCYKHHEVLAEKLGFGSVIYQAGPFFKRTTKRGQGFQIDLLYDRNDRVLTLCEMKYSKEKISKAVIKEVEKKIELLREYFPNKAIEPVLVTTIGVSKDLQDTGFFRKVLTVKDLL